MRLLTALSLCVSLVPSLAWAAPPAPASEAAEAAPDAPDAEAEQRARELSELDESLRYQSGDVVVGDNLATLRLGDSLRFLGAKDASKVLEAWGNPPGSEPLGLVVPKEMSPFEEESWAVVVTYEEEGHVDDTDAKEIDFDELLSEMKDDAEASNEERAEAGFPTVKLVGWAEPPHYDEGTRKLYWAKELDFGASDHTLNYNIRVLGRRGVLELNAVGSMAQLSMIKAGMPAVLKAVDFNPGMRYADFNPGTDQLAAYGIGALVAGKLAAKAGLFKVIVAALIASKKLIGAAVVGLLMLAKRLFSSKKAEQSE